MGLQRVGHDWATFTSFRRLEISSYVGCSQCKTNRRTNLSGKMWVMAFFSMRRVHAVYTPIHISYGPGHVCSMAVLEWRLGEYSLIFLCSNTTEVDTTNRFLIKVTTLSEQDSLSPLFLRHPNPSTMGKSYQQGKEDITYERNLHLVHKGNLGIKGMFPYLCPCITINKISRIYPASHYLSHQIDR